MSDKQSICLDCIYGSQPYGYYPIVCVYDEKRIKEFRTDKHKCKHFEKAPEPPKPMVQTPWQVKVTKVPLQGRVIIEHYSKQPMVESLGYAISCLALDYKGKDVVAEHGKFRFNVKTVDLGVLIEVYDKY